MILNNNFSTTVHISFIHVFEVMIEKEDFMCLLWNDGGSVYSEEK